MPKAQAKQETTHAIAYAVANHTVWFWPGVYGRPDRRWRGSSLGHSKPPRSMRSSEKPGIRPPTPSVGVLAAGRRMLQVEGSPAHCDVPPPQRDVAVAPDPCPRTANW